LKEEHMADMAVSATQDEFATILNRVADGKERIVLHRDGEPVAAVIPVEDLKLLERLIEKDLEADPRPPGVIALEGHEGLLRQRVGNDRIVYRVNDDALKVLIAEIGHCRAVDRGL